MLHLLLPILTPLLDRLIPDKNERERAKRELTASIQQNQHAIDLAQIEVNKAEGKHRSIFVAGWRPFVGWICASAFLWHFMLKPISEFAMAYAGVAQPTLPAFDITTLTTVLFGLLGLGGLRTYEKLKGITK